MNQPNDTSGPDGLVAFLRARLGEDEAEARATADADAEFWADVKGDGTHFARHDPVRVLREVEAGRRVLAWYEDTLGASEVFREKLGTGTHMSAAAESYLNVIRALAAIYADHPGYDPGWAL